MFQNIEVLSPKKAIRVHSDLENEKGRDSENDTTEENDEYIVTNLTENGRNMPKLIIRIPANLNKLLTEEQEKIEVVDQVKCDDTVEDTHKNMAFKLGKNNKIIKLTEPNSDTKKHVDYKLEAIEEKYGTMKHISNDEEDEEDDDEDDDDDDDDEQEENKDEENEKVFLKSFKSRSLEKYKPNVYNENMTFLRNHTNDELSYFLNKKNVNSYTEMKINDIINIDYDKLNEKSIIPYFLTHMYDVEQRRKREKIKKEITEKRKALADKNKRKSVNGRKRKSGIVEKSPKKGKNGKITDSKITKANNLKKEEETEKKNRKTKKEFIKKEDDDGDENEKEEKKEEEEEEEEEDEEEEEENAEDVAEDDEEEGDEGTGIKGINKRRGKKKKDNDDDDDEFDKEENEINVYNDPKLYGIEGSSDYSEGFKSDEDNTQEEEEEDIREDSTTMVSSSGVTNTNQMETKKKRKRKGKGANIDPLANNESLDDIIDSSTEKLISYDYYSSLNINEFVKPSYKIKYLSSFIPVEDNIDNYDEIQKLQYLIKHLPHTHIKEKRSLYFYNIKQFIKWKTYLLNNINICLYGIGSKFHILNLFSKVCLTDGHKCTILGFEQEVNFDEILIRILEVHYNFKAPKSLKSYDLLYKLVNLVKENNVPLYFIIHNLDNVKLYTYYEYFSFLSQYPNIYFICSIDDVSFELNMNFKNISSMNMFYMKCHTWIDYRYEIIKHWNRFPPEWVYNKRSEEVDGQKNFETILNALNINHKRLFKIIASIQLENLEKGIFGVEKELLLQDKRMFTVGASNIRINSLLVEFVSHNVITETRLKEGNTFLKINADKEQLKRLIEKL